MSPGARASFTADLLSETRDEITRADNKANILLVGAGIALTTFLAGIVSGQIDPRHTHAVVLGAGIAAATLLGAGTMMLAYTVYPRVGPAEAGRARYFAEIATQSNLDELRQALDKEATDREERDLQQLYVLSRIAATKYRHTRLGAALLAAGLACSALTGVLQLLLGH